MLFSNFILHYQTFSVRMNYDKIVVVLLLHFLKTGIATKSMKERNCMMLTKIVCISRKTTYLHNSDNTLCPKSHGAVSEAYIFRCNMIETLLQNMKQLSDEEKLS